MLGLGVDRADYTKGIVERFRSIEKFLEQNPEWLGRFSFLQIAVPTRTQIPRYSHLKDEIEEVARAINDRFGQGSVPAIILKMEQRQPEEIFKLYRAADFCMVTPLHDGMNLVAKEYVAARSDLRGVLILSRFAGAAVELDQALLVNPYSIQECATAIRKALSMSDSEKEYRMKAMRDHIAEKNIYSWAGEMITEIAQVGRRRGLRTALFSGSGDGRESQSNRWYN
jgi:trehalose 6-phosphate synthase